MAPLQLVGGSLLLQLSPGDVANPGRLYQALQMLMGNLDQFSQKVAVCVNTNQALATTTGGRPPAAQLTPLPNSGVGWSMLDTTLGVPIWWTGTHWVNASGATV